MNARTPLLVAVSLVCVALVVGAGGFTSVDAERGVDVTVANDENAFLSVETNSSDPGTENHGDTHLLTITNQFDSSITITDVRVTDGPSPTSSASTNWSGLEPPASLSVGESATLTAEGTCAGGGDRTKQFTVALSATTENGEAISLTRTTEVTCSSGSVQEGSGETTTESSTNTGTDTAQS